ncbi:MAG: 4Fe-4S binding protein [Candidatus Omnitrophota bacterium]
MSNQKLTNYNLLRKEALKQGAELFGVADISKEKKNFELQQDVLKNFNWAVCLVIPLSASILNTIEAAPNKIYFHHYRIANSLLDQIAFKLANFIQAKGFRALPIPASQILNWQKQSAHLSHKKIGYLAGLGWIGRNNLLVNQDLGCQFRLVTILTDMPLKIGRPLKKDCDSCRACIEVCPVGAIKEKKEDFDYQRCFEKLKEFQKSGAVGQYICGICVKACKG